jgi:large subunit ribosomal protein L5
MSRLKEKYLKEILPNLQKELGLTNSMQVPRIKKITLNMGVGEVLQDKKAIEKAQSDLEKLSGQKPLITKAKKSVASFKIRDGMPIGVKVTLRKNRMYEFLDRLINIALPRVRDFRGLNMKSFDGTGNYSLGIKEQIIFPEIDYDNVDKIRGLDITITTSAQNNEEALALLNAFNFPIRQRVIQEETTEAVAPEAEETTEAVAPEAEETTEAVAPEVEETTEAVAPEVDNKEEK